MYIYIYIYIYTHTYLYTSVSLCHSGPVLAGDTDTRRASRVKAADQAASNMPTLGRLRGKALSAASVGSRSLTSVHSSRSDGTGELDKCTSRLYCLYSVITSQCFTAGGSGERWSRGRAPDCQSRGRWFNPTYRCF